MWVKNQPVYCSQISGGGYEEGTQAYASRMWGVTPEEYMRIADPWPMNPDGELLFRLKIENPRADANVENFRPRSRYRLRGMGSRRSWLLHLGSARHL